MNVTEIFIKRPVLAICINLIIFVAGLTAINKLPTRQYPKSDLSVINVKTAFVGASSELVKGYVTTPLERVISSADGIDYIESSSKQGVSEIKAHLVLNYDVGRALTQVQAKIAQVRNDLPPSSELPIIEVQTADSRFASIYIGFSSDVLNGNQITDYLTRVVQPQFSSVIGVQKAEILGDRTFAMRVWLKSDKMNALNVSATDVRDALVKNNYLSALGSSKGALLVTPLKANTDLTSEAEFQNLIVKSDKDRFIRLRDVAKVELGAENYDVDVRFDGKQAVFMGVWVLPDANSLEVIRNLRKTLPQIKKNLPQGLNLDIPHDKTLYIDSAIDDVIKTLIETILIVVFVIYLFIGSFKSVLVPVVAIPLSLVGAVGLMALMGFTINLLTLLAIVLAVGLVVDDAIVMLENIESHIKQGLSSKEAAIKGAKELLGPVIAMTITLAAVYAPIGIQGGLTGALFKEFAFTLSGAVIVSGFVALTLSPMMSAKLINSSLQKGKESNFKKKSNAYVKKIENSYLSFLNKSLNIKALIVTFSIMLVLIIPLLYMLCLKELAPREDEGIVFGIVQSGPNSTLEKNLRYTKEVHKAYSSLDEYKTSFQITTPAGGFSGALAKPWSQRSRTTQEMAQSLWPKTAGITGIRLIVTTPPPLPGGSNFPVEMNILSTDEPDKMIGIAKTLVQTAFASGKFMFANTDLLYDLPQSELIIDREKVAAAGLDLQIIGQELSTYLGGNFLNRFSISGRSYKVIPQLERKWRLTSSQLNDIKISTPDGNKVPLASFASIKNTVIPRELNKFQQLNSIKVYGVPVPGTSIDQGLSVLEQKAREIIPSGYIIDYPGESRQLRKEQNTFTKTLLLSLVFIYLVLAAQFESFRDPFIILFGSVPLSLASALVFPFLGFTSLNIYSQVGLVTLVGLVSKNGILIVEFANVLKEEGLSKLEAITKASVKRLRPILMTSFATVIGHFPLILASGAGASARNSIGIVLVSGMFIGTFFTLFVVPVLYVLISKESLKRSLN